LFAYNSLESDGMQVSDQRNYLMPSFPTRTLCIHSNGRGYIAVRFRENSSK
jgi:hypothetical protein